MEEGQTARRQDADTWSGRHASDFVEHPELVAERVVKYAHLLGRENIIAGTDCGLETRVGHPKIAWAKFEAMAEGARIATRQLWNI
jgi:5-methyltetrahydropteroyltriglutamate--homocysteine methyltransferase